MVSAESGDRTAPPRRHRPPQASGRTGAGEQQLITTGQLDDRDSTVPRRTAQTDRCDDAAEVGASSGGAILGGPGASDVPEDEARTLGATYLDAYVRGRQEELRHLARAHQPAELLDALAAAAHAMVLHLATLEHSSAEVITGAYRDVWS